MKTRMHFDDVAWEESERITDSWVEWLLADEDTLRAIGHLILKHRSGVPEELGDPKAGYFNISFRMKYLDGSSVIIRFPKPGATMFPEEKIRNEVAAIRYIQKHTSIPVPSILYCGTAEESPPRMGPFIIMEYIEHETNMSRALNMPGLGIEDRPRLDPNIDIEKLKMLYGQLAEILLQLNKLSFPRIGSLEQVNNGTYEVTQRPLSIHMNELVRLGTLSRSSLPRGTFESASSYFDALADLHMEHLTHQRNDAIDSATDCRRKYVARQLFRKLSSDRQLTASARHPDSSFKLWCDDLRPSNVLLNADLQVVGVIDWEFTYAAPAEFSAAPPWWLLLEQPEYWPGGINEWTKVYDYRLKSFLKVLSKREEILIESGRLSEEQRLSGHMRESWRSGDFWVSYAARKNFAFDAIFWQKLDERFFGPGTLDESWKERLKLLDDNQKQDMESLVEKKLKEMESWVLAWEPDEQSEPSLQV
ncbi:phosphotransferase family protein [Aspergillus ibericus CBS 121593]|uniref:Phosphotransferase family protein n=1 Tax=Aspergillus ibericus CBS 121593 TaxID=1448316 RepID=A0A395H4G8_9EURO|nr:phosphotransferase family protein [Aspergillus ibericus CBS 121593]RAL02646.1 phosphotransferase family protein [Aspergillus ibericus CBS 121593]